MIFKGKRNGIGESGRLNGMRPVFACLALFLVGCSKPTPSTQQSLAPAGQAAPTSPPIIVDSRPGLARRDPVQTETVQMAPPVRESLALAAGTPIRVRTTSTLSSKTHAAGTMFTATLDGPLMRGNRVVAPSLSRVEGVVSSVDPGGRVKGRATLAIRLTSLTLPNGRTVALNTNSYGVQARGTKKKDSLKIGLGAGIGAAIGALAGGGKGAAIGAASGGGAGTGLVLATKGEPAVIPAESRIRFVLSGPIVFP